LPRHQTAIFVHGCFWHRHQNCKVASTPKSNTAFWKEKFTKNVARDVRDIEALQKRGWNVVVAWECELRSASRAIEVAERIAGCLTRVRTPHKRFNTRGRAGKMHLRMSSEGPIKSRWAPGGLVH
jgi:G:T-mismatch repair DNA endonuclease (very short patch repair protein)